jgi:hypothetical protein
MVAMRTFFASMTATLSLAALLAGCGSNPESSPALPAKPGAAEKHSSVVWIERDIEHEGSMISLGYRDQSKADTPLEPVTAITRDGKPVADAMVFNRLVDADTGDGLGDEVATIYEPSPGSDPAIYAQGKLKRPDSTKKCKVRFRVVLPNVDQEWQRDVELPVK